MKHDSPQFIGQQHLCNVASPLFLPLWIIRICGLTYRYIRSYYIFIAYHSHYLQGQNEVLAEGSNDALLFCIVLTKITTVLGPIAKAIQCLESAHTTCADVYLFFLAIVAQLDQVFSKNSIKLSQASIEGVRAIINKCFDEIINKSHNNPYVPLFFLNPRQ